jgi:putative inorganic carbon (hco3(-)) transporter
MGRLFFLMAFSVLSVVSLTRPWIGVVGAYAVAILTPQAVWYWNFGDLRPGLWVILPTCIGMMFALLRGQFDLGRMASSRIVFLVTLWLCFALSYAFGPYTDVMGPYRFTDPGWAFGTLNKMFLLCLLACLAIDSLKKIWSLSWVIALSGAYLVYWANDQYLAGRVMGRLAGPVDVYGIGAYSDENNFAMLFVVVQPFLWYLGLSVKQTWLRWALWLIIPFTWHAVFLTASRGGLIGIGVSVLVIALRSKRRMLGLLLIPAFFVAYQWQAGDLMKERAGTISEYQTETSAATRIQAWKAAAGMIADNPIVGVGLASFGAAFPDYSDAKPREAHNTFLQIAAESGLIAGLMYVLLGVGSIVALWRNGNRLKKIAAVEGQDNRLYLLNEAALGAMSGFIVCALFLSLQMFEIFFCLCALVHAIMMIDRRPAKADAPGVLRKPIRPMPRPAVARQPGSAVEAPGTHNGD